MWRSDLGMGSKKNKKGKKVSLLRRAGRQPCLGAANGRKKKLFSFHGEKKKND